MNQGDCEYLLSAYLLGDPEGGLCSLHAEVGCPSSGGKEQRVYWRVIRER